MTVIARRSLLAGSRNLLGITTASREYEGPHTLIGRLWMTTGHAEPVLLLAQMSPVTPSSCDVLVVPHDDQQPHRHSEDG